MSENLKYISGLFAAIVILIGLILAGCSAGGTGSTTQDTSSPPSQTTTTSELSSTTPASTTTGSGTSGSKASPTQSNAPAGRQGGADMNKMFARAAEILGITEAQLTSAFQQAQESVFGKAPTGTAPSGASGQPPERPSGTSGQQPPSQGQGPDQESMQKVYSKMSEILNMSADKISSAMDQARQELQTGTSQ